MTKYYKNKPVTVLSQPDARHRVLIKTAEGSQHCVRVGSLREKRPNGLRWWKAKGNLFLADNSSTIVVPSRLVEDFRREIFGNTKEKQQNGRN